MNTELKSKPKSTNSLGQQELDKAEEHFNSFDKNIKEMTLDRMNKAPIEETEPQTKIAQKDLYKSKDIYLKPKRSIGSKEKFNERFREQYDFAKELVHFTAENKEIIGETIDLWTKPFPGMPAEEWEVPANVPVWGPRYLAEQIHNCKYHRFVMKQNVSTGADLKGEYYGSMAADTTVQRMDAIPVSSRRSVFMGAGSGF